MFRFKTLGGKCQFLVNVKFKADRNPLRKKTNKTLVPINDHRERKKELGNRNRIVYITNFLIKFLLYLWILTGISLGL